MSELYKCAAAFENQKEGNDQRNNDHEEPAGHDQAFPEIFVPEHLSCCHDTPYLETVIFEVTQ